MTSNAAPTLTSPNSLLAKTLKRNAPKLSPRGDLNHVRVDPEPATNGYVVTAHHEPVKPDGAMPEPVRNGFSSAADASAHVASLLAAHEAPPKGK